MHAGMVFTCEHVCRNGHARDAVCAAHDDCDNLLLEGSTCLEGCSFRRRLARQVAASDIGGFADCRRRPLHHLGRPAMFDDLQSACDNPCTVLDVAL